MWPVACSGWRWNELNVINIKMLQVKFFLGALKNVKNISQNFKKIS